MTIWAALITGLFAVLVALIQYGHRRNTKEHADNAERLDGILLGMGRMEQKLDDHLDAHRDGLE